MWTAFCIYFVAWEFVGNGSSEGESMYAHLVGIFTRDE